MAWFIDDLDQYQIFVTDTIREYYIPKFRIEMEVEEPYLYLRFNDRERGTGGDVRLLTFNYNDVVDGYSGYVSNPTSASDLKTQIEAMIISGWTSIAGGDLLTAKADLLSHDGITDTILPGGTNEYILSRDNTELTGLKWIPKTSVTVPGGSDGQVQYNNGGTLDGDPGLLYDDTDVILSVNGHNPMTVNGVAQTTHLEVHGEANSNHSEIEMHRHSTGDGVKIFGARSRGSFASPSVVQSGDVLMNMMAVGYDGTDFAQSSEIEMAVDGTPGSNDMPGRIVFRTAADGTQTLTERARISANGDFRVANLSGSGAKMVVVDNDGDLGIKNLPSFVIGYTGNVASTNTASEEVLFSVLIPGGTMGAGDAIKVTWGLDKSVGSGNWTTRVKLHTAATTGGTAYTTMAYTGTIKQLLITNILNTASNVQIGSPATTLAGYGQFATAYSTSALDTANDMYVNITSQKVTGTDSAALVWAFIEICKLRT